MKIAIYGNSLKQNCKEYIETLLLKLQENNIQIKIFEPFYSSWKKHLQKNIKEPETFKEYYEVDKDTDFMLSLGGDGTFLESVVYIRDKNIPIVGINLGRLGFLASIKQEDITLSIEQIIDKKYTLEERSLIYFEGNDHLFNNFPYALNEVTVQKKDTSMITVHTYLNNEYLNSYWADGLIISTSTGSTAYSLSVGGPIVLPRSRNIVICPIAPHNLSVRPIIAPEDCKVKLKLESRSKTFLATVDNRTEVLDINTEITLKTAAFRIKMLHLENYNFYHTIRNKLMWGMDKRN